MKDFRKIYLWIQGGYVDTCIFFFNFFIRILNQVYFPTIKINKLTQKKQGI